MLHDFFCIVTLVTWRSLDSIAYASGTNMQTVAVDDDGSVDSTNIRVRRLFPEVWLFNSTTAGLVLSFCRSLRLRLFITIIFTKSFPVQRFPSMTYL